MDNEAREEWLQYEALMQRLRPGRPPARETLTLADVIEMFIDDVFDGLEDARLQGGEHG
jgi:hypothetical protein